jgi:hypothetical protein
MNFDFSTAATPCSHVQLVLILYFFHVLSMQASIGVQLHPYAKIRHGLLPARAFFKCKFD